MLTEQQVNDAVEFAKDIITLATLYNFSVTSWGRTASHNAELQGSVKNSQHLMWLAVDIVRDADCDKDDFLASCADLNLQVIDEPTHLHVMARRTT